MVLGQKHIPQPQLSGLGFQLLEDSRSSGPSLGSLTQFSLENGISGDAVFLNEFLDLKQAASVSMELGRLKRMSQPRVFSFTRALVFDRATTGLRMIYFKG